MSATTIDMDDLVREHRFDELVRNEQARIVRIIFRFCGNWADAEEAVQEALVKLWADRTQLDHIDNLTGWLVTEAKWKVRTLAHQRRRAVPALLGEDIEWVESQTVDPSSLPCTADPEVQARIRVALAALSPRQRDVVRAHCLHGMSIAEIAEKRGLTTSTVHSTLWRALHEADLSGSPWEDRRTERAVESPEAEVFRKSPTLLALLPAKQQQAVRLRYVQRLSLAEVGKEMGCSLGYASELLNRARRTLRTLAADLVAVQ
ncbi:sigma-70 family RNA polymerase sigma factor [Micromonospora sp. NPDC051300]|uniref:sigma-70 family RNA polymerase sigma factor n=1 Tax=Micromonospora sp. NPDC051300 TaxID=3364286 RepID=UPI00378E3AC6